MIQNLLSCVMLLSNILLVFYSNFFWVLYLAYEHCYFPDYETQDGFQMVLLQMKVWIKVDRDIFVGVGICIRRIVLVKTFHCKSQWLDC